MHLARKNSMVKIIGIVVLIFFMAQAGVAVADDGLFLKNRATLSFEYDDNVYKSNRDEEGDFLGRLYYDFRLNYFPTVNNQLSCNYQGGVKKYIETIDQDTLVNQIKLGYTNFSIDKSYLGTESTLKIRNIRSAQEDYNKFIGDLFAGHEFGKGINGEIRGGYTRFDFKSYNYYDYWLQRYGFNLQKSFTAKYLFAVQYFLQDKHFPFYAYTNVGSETGDVFLGETDEKRRDTLHEPALMFRFSGWLLLDFSYLLQINQSNSYGDSYYNHRFTLGMSKAVMKNTHLHLLAIAQFRDSSEEVLIPHSYSIEEDDENYNSVRAKVSQRITDYLFAEVGYSRYWTTYSSRDLNFVKNLYSIGLAVNF